MEFVGDCIFLELDMLFQILVIWNQSICVIGFLVLFFVRYKECYFIFEGIILKKGKMDIVFRSDYCVFCIFINFRRVFFIFKIVKEWKLICLGILRLNWFNLNFLKLCLFYLFVLVIDFKIRIIVLIFYFILNLFFCKEVQVVSFRFFY